MFGVECCIFKLADRFLSSGFTTELIQLMMDVLSSSWLYFLKVAIEGCCHGELDQIYETIGFIEAQNNFRIDLLLICGDFQVHLDTITLNSRPCLTWHDQKMMNIILKSVSLNCVMVTVGKESGRFGLFGLPSKI